MIITYSRIYVFVNGRSDKSHKRRCCCVISNCLLLKSMCEWAAHLISHVGPSLILPSLVQCFLVSFTFFLSERGDRTQQNEGRKEGLTNKGNGNHPLLSLSKKKETITTHAPLFTPPSLPLSSPSLQSPRRLTAHCQRNPESNLTNGLLPSLLTAAVPHG